MATIHLYVRTQVTTDDPAAIETAMHALRQAVETAGGTWRGGLTVDAAAAPEAAAPEAGEATPPPARPAHTPPAPRGSKGSHAAR